MRNILLILSFTSLLIACSSKAPNVQSKAKDDRIVSTGDSADAKPGTFSPVPATGNRWTSEEEEAFNKTCVENAKAGMGEEKAKGYCSCMLQKMEDKFRTPNDADTISMSQTMEWAKQCLK